MEKGDLANFIVVKEMNLYRCLRCHHEWIPRVDIKRRRSHADMQKDAPRICPQCKTAYWNVPKKNATSRTRVTSANSKMVR